MELQEVESVEGTIIPSSNQQEKDAWISCMQDCYLYLNISNTSQALYWFIPLIFYLTQFEIYLLPFVYCFSNIYLPFKNNNKKKTTKKETIKNTNPLNRYRPSYLLFSKIKKNPNLLGVSKKTLQGLSAFKHHASCITDQAFNLICSAYCNKTKWQGPRFQLQKRHVMHFGSPLFSPLPSTESKGHTCFDIVVVKCSLNYGS